ncbi:MAG: hypothetical protein SFV32_07130 [Opitutaceae bacterium]|nr:hypothetical protein [Opitutaceae bacterium]
MARANLAERQGKRSGSSVLIATVEWENGVWPVPNVNVSNLVKVQHIEAEDFLAVHASTITRSCSQGTRGSFHVRVEIHFA